MWFSNKYKATLILGMSTIGYLAAVPYQASFWGGLITSGFEAAMIGGLADWFAVSALFRVPLIIRPIVRSSIFVRSGINKLIRTNVIGRNREKICYALTSMIENEILRPENIKQHLANIKITEMLAKVIDSYKVRDDIKRILYHLSNEFINQIQPQTIGALLSKLVKAILYNKKIASALLKALEWLIAKGYYDKLADFVIKQLIELIGSSEVKNYLIGIVSTAITSYERGMNRRIIFNAIIDLAPENVAYELQKFIYKKLIAMEDKNNKWRQLSKAWLIAWTAEKQQDAVFCEGLDCWIQSKIHTFNLEEIFAKIFIDICQRPVADNRQLLKEVESFINLLECQTKDYLQDENNKIQLEVSIKNIINNLLDGYHHEIGCLVMEKLKEFSDDFLVAFIEEKVGHDLQMIRINGSVVGGIVGMIIYLLTYWL